MTNENEMYRDLKHHKHATFIIRTTERVANLLGQIGANMIDDCTTMNFAYEIDIEVTNVETRRRTFELMRGHNVVIIDMIDDGEGNFVL